MKLADRQLRVERPRLRRKGGGEEAVPAYEALRKSEKTGEEMFEALLRGFDAELPRGDPGDGQQRWGVEVSPGSGRARSRRLEELLARRWEEVFW